MRHIAEWHGQHLAGLSKAAGRNLPDHLVEVLDQLASGATDLAACRKLGVSRRTYSRRVSELLEHLGVASRFQAGMVAARLGLTRQDIAPCPPHDKGLQSADR